MLLGCSARRLYTAWAAILQPAPAGGGCGAWEARWRGRPLPLYCTGCHLAGRLPAGGAWEANRPGPLPLHLNRSPRGEAQHQRRGRPLPLYCMGCHLAGRLPAGGAWEANLPGPHPLHLNRSPRGEAQHQLCLISARAAHTHLLLKTRPPTPTSRC
jgi:hypothetical protein